MQTQLKTLFDLWLTESADAESIQTYVDIHLMCFLCIWEELWLCTMKLFCTLVAKSCFEMMPIGATGLWRFSYIVPKATYVASSVVELSTWSPSTGHRAQSSNCLSVRNAALFIYYLWESSVADTRSQAHYVRRSLQWQTSDMCTMGLELRVSPNPKCLFII